MPLSTSISRQKTAYEISECDWSSDVCSSDLPPRNKPGELPMYHAPARPVKAEAVGKYAIRFTWSDGHEHGIYSWDFLRDICPCAECRAKSGH